MWQGILHFLHSVFIFVVAVILIFFVGLAVFGSIAEVFRSPGKRKRRPDDDEKELFN